MLSELLIVQLLHKPVINDCWCCYVMWDFIWRAVWGPAVLMRPRSKHLTDWLSIWSEEVTGGANRAGWSQYTWQQQLSHPYSLPPGSAGSAGSVQQEDLPPCQCLCVRTRWGRWKGLVVTRHSELPGRHSADTYLQLPVNGRDREGGGALGRLCWLVWWEDLCCSSWSEWEKKLLLTRLCKRKQRNVEISWRPVSQKQAKCPHAQPDMTPRLRAKTSQCEHAGLPCVKGNMFVV